MTDEVGNPAGAILGYLDLLAKGGMPPDETLEVLRLAGNETERIRGIIQDLLDFSKPSPSSALPPSGERRARMA